MLRTQRLALEPIEPGHADRLFVGLQDPGLYAFIDDLPPQHVDALRARFEKLAGRKSPDGAQIWLNWALKVILRELYVGYVQATVKQDRTADVAYLLFRDFQGNGYAREAVT